MVRTVVSILRRQTEDLRLPALHFTLAAFLPLLALYALTTDKSFPHHGDAYTNAVTAWSLGTRGSVFVEDLAGTDFEAGYGRAYWFVDSERGPVSKYPPGAAALAAPAYALIRPDFTIGVGSAGLEGTRPAFAGEILFVPIWPATVVAALATAIGVTALALASRTLVSDRVALGAAYVGGLGTTAWSVAADGLWQHGPAIMWLGLGILALSRDQHALAGVALGFAIMTRPQVAAIAAVMGVTSAWAARSWRKLLAIGLPAAFGFGFYFSYNLAIFGSLLPEASGGYFLEGAAKESAAGTIGAIVRAALDPGRGFLIWSPFLVLLLPGLRQAWRTAPGWVRGAALGGAVYFVVQMRGNLWSGGVGQFTYRYPLEMLAAATPLLASSYQSWVDLKASRRTAFRFAAAASIAAHAVGAWL